MSQTTGIPVYNFPTDTGYRLLELRPDLLSILESPEAPPSLKLETGDDSALLKAGGKTWALRQKNTSNALILMRPHGDNGLAAMSTVHEIVELDAVKEDKPEGQAAPLSAKGKWHEKFGKKR
ncbi:uncharacterized protein F5Z01DRAFT_636372 [Emericellopsis atlantica]|uniref:Sister chromatid cohesion protein DCC1 n=1 Tax=Emericellopsis atlantica TaxID=2614577 RepID=A0A9P8CPM9_9HYPO|nr:uncharacterized protein F5Z01DRAFT_636372 [Emericellopsis atlantica]KAG9254295.1 hypothetical protein F5Z01DRAFT_636372 [Emericellopsis atlantica]